MTDETTTTEDQARIDELLADGNMDDILEWVGDDAAYAARAWEVESAKTHPRPKLIKALEALLADTAPPVDRTPAEAEAELAAELVKTGDDRDQARIDELLAELGPKPGPAGQDASPSPAAPSGPTVEGPVVMAVTSDVEIGDVVVTGGAGYEIVGGADGTTVKVDETGAVTEIL